MTVLFVFAAVLAVYSIFSRRLEASIFGAPIVFVTVGLIFSVSPFDLLSLHYRHVNVLLIGQAALVLVLYSDALRVRLHELRSGAYIPGRLLTVGLLLTIATGTAIAAVLFTSLGFWEAAVLAAILAPTDAGLGQAVISDRRIPTMIRNSLNVESGLNDGIVTPFFFIFIGIVVAEEEHTRPLLSSIRHIGEDLAVGVFAGLAVGYVGARLIRWSLERDGMSHVYRQAVFPGVALFAWQLAEQLNGNGFVAAFVAGVVTARIIRSLSEDMTEYLEVSSELAVLAVFLIFGIASTTTLGDIGLRGWVYALLSLTVIRMVPVALSLVGTGLRTSTILFIGWFGPRGLASIVLLLLLLNEYPEVEGIPVIAAVVTITVLISVYAHGLSAKVLTGAYSRRLEAAPPTSPEFEHAATLPTRRQETPTLNVHLERPSAET